MRYATIPNHHAVRVPRLRSPLEGRADRTDRAPSADAGSTSADDRGRAASATPVRAAAWVADRGFPKVELLRTPEGLLLRAALPGVRREDLLVRLEESDLILEGELRPDGDTGIAEPLAREWCYGRFHRRIQLGACVDPSSVRTELRDGMLRVELRPARARAA